MKNKQIMEIELTEHSKAFKETTDLIGGKTAKWSFPTFESLIAQCNPEPEAVNYLRFVWEGCLEQVKHHLVSDWMKSDQRLLDDGNASAEDKAAAKNRMEKGYSFDYSKSPKLSSQQGNERSGQRWGKYSKYVPLAKTLVDQKLEVDTDAWREAVIAKCEQIKKATESITKG
jgi:hypothetical protein